MIEFKPNKRYQIKTPEGYRDFSGIRKTIKKEVVTFNLTDGRKVQASLDHRFIVGSKEILARHVREGDYLTPTVKVESLTVEQGLFTLYDPVDVGTAHLFIADGITSHNCNFLASGDTVIEPEILSFYEETYQVEPIVRRGMDGTLWVWEYPDYTKSYIVMADVARGDGGDFSTFHILDTEACSQVAEFKSKLSPREFGNVLVGIAAEYNDALLVIENANIGWATIEQVLERGYKNLYYSTKSEQDTVESYMSKYERAQLVPGFSTTSRTRPLIIAKLMEYIRDKSCVIKSKRLLTELRVFIWKNGKAQAQSGYNDDLVTAFAMGLYVRDTAMRLHQQGMDLTRAQMQTFLTSNTRTPAVKAVGYQKRNPYIIDGEDISWILK